MYIKLSGYGSVVKRGHQMSAHGGIVQFDSKPVDQQLVAKLSAGCADYGADRSDTYMSGQVGSFHQAFHTTRESLLERQPYISKQGTVILWDGRLDNRDELVTPLAGYLRDDHTDVALVAAAFDRWATACFINLIGDWALAVWDPHSRSLFLATDYIGVRHLY